MRWFACVVVLTGCTSLFDLSDVPSIDQDNDGVIDPVDNCPAAFNPDQSDFDRNAVGDACDVCVDARTDDVDGDGIPDACDGCIGIGVDADGDRIDDGCDPCQNTYRDVDEDGVDDGCDACIGASTGVDIDADGVDDSCDQCIGIGSDSDGDGIDDGCDVCQSTAPKLDEDGDLIEDACDACVSTDMTDIDGDKIQDVCDPCACIPVPNCGAYIDHDEDGDHVDDGCDTCKVTPNAGDMPGFDDNVGDACDPDGTRQDIEHFDSFASIDPRWYIAGSGWTIANDAAHVSAFSYPAYRVLEAAVSGSYRVRVRIDGSMLGTGARIAVFVADTLPQPANEKLACVMSVFSPGPVALVNGFLSLEETASKQTTTLGTSSTSFNAKQMFDLELDTTSSKIACYAYALDGTLLLGVTTGSASAQASYPGVEIQSATVSFSYFYAVGGNF